MSSDFPSLDEFEQGNTAARPHTDSQPQQDDLGFSDFTHGHASATSTKFPDIGEAGDLLNAEEDFQSAFPQLEQQPAPSGMISAPTEPYVPGFQTAATAAQPSSDFTSGEEPEVVREWRARQQQQIERRDAESAKKKEKQIADAQKQIDDFYDQYNAKRDKSVAAIRKEQEAFLAKRDETTSGGTSWERIVKLIDTKDKAAVRGSRDVSRMRDLLLDLRKDADAPSAGL
ncbi:clathrin light chain [Protomyces lactucae-debilis]|uniref:Clathrin light chain n=1 Tax=Protomyces lactucae-debilis TaxID=2754530 RepID=A0A1Y2FQ21_PROLT|nr:clathrin light chain [Protomyces lactucae-debilis]ORY84805.1 clathrin light chain [Protomyces lactucae-debilis]